MFLVKLMFVSGGLIGITSNYYLIREVFRKHQQEKSEHMLIKGKTLLCDGESSNNKKNNHKGYIYKFPIRR